tara:strand:- start:441 stop:1361 length:921 start_codon:yes stop_codon:yes gene_type:complete
MNNIPWVEKYRPTKFDDIILDDINKEILNSIITKQYMPNILFYGPPGTGKTTTIINLINSLQINVNKSSVIHLNASDERGIDIIRNQINQFVQSSSLFCKGIKFVVLDEIDYMTKNAQTALKCLLQTFNKNIRFCLICNYISKVDESLQNEFMRLRFNQLPTNKIIDFLKNINMKEKLNLSDDTLKTIQDSFGSDIRSMINYIQANYYNLNKIQIQNHNITWNELFDKFINKSTLEEIISDFQYINKNYNIEYKNIILKFINYIIQNKKQYVTSELIHFFEYIVHSNYDNNEYVIHCFISKLLKIL